MTEYSVYLYGLGIGLNGFYGDDVIAAECLIVALMVNE